MCSDGTCYSCRQKVADQNAREGTFAAPWRRTPKPKLPKRVVNPDEGDPLNTSYLDFNVIRALLRQSEEGGKKGKEEK